MLPQRQKRFFIGRAGRDEHPVRFGFSRLRIRQGLAVDFAAGQGREAAHFHEQRRHHVGRQPGAQERSVLSFLKLVAGRQNQVGNESGHVVGAGFEGHRGVAHAGELQQQRLDFGQLDAVAAQFHLRVDAPQKLHLAAGREATQIAGAVETAAQGRLRSIDFNKLASREFGPVEVAGSQRGPADADFAFQARCHGLPGLVEQPHDVARHRPPDGERTARHEVGAGGNDGGLRGSVSIHNASTGPAPGSQQLGRAHLAAQNQQVHRVHRRVE